jgi:hypothetical protein
MVDWDPVARTPDFSPIGRHLSWSGRRRRRFAWIAGEMSRAFGYEVDAGIRNRWFDIVENRVRDRLWRMSIKLQERCFLVGRAVTRSTPDFTTGVSHYYERVAAPRRLGWDWGTWRAREN